jgi:hypothetical protein
MEQVATECQGFILRDLITQMFFLALGLVRPITVGGGSELKDGSQCQLVSAMFKGREHPHCMGCSSSQATNGAV